MKLATTYVVIKTILDCDGQLIVMNQSQFNNKNDAYDNLENFLEHCRKNEHGAVIPITLSISPIELKLT